MAVNQLKGGVALSYVSIFLTNVIGLVLTPFIIRSLGTAEYGLYTMIGALVGYMSVLDFGLNKTVVRFVAKFRAEKDKKGEENFLAHAFIIFGIISTLILIGGSILYVNLEGLYKDTLTADQLDKAKIMLAILAFNMSLLLPGGAFRGMCTGCEEFILPRVFNIVRYIIRSITVVALLMLGGDAVGIVIIDTIMNILFIIANATVAFRKLNVKIYLHKFQKVLLKTIFGFSIWIFVFALVNQFRWQLGQLVLGLNYDTTIVAIYAVAITLGNYYGAFSSAIASVFLPKAMKMVTSNASNKELTNMFIRISRIILLVLLFVLGGFVLVGKDFVYFWVGDEFKDSYLQVILMMIGLLPLLSQGFATNILEAKNKLQFRGLLLLGLTILGTIFGAYLSLEYSATGMILGTVIFMLIDRIIISWYYNYKIKLEMVRYYKETFNLYLFSGLLILLIVYLNQFIPEHSIKYSLLKVITYTIIYVLVFRVLLTESEKTLFKGIIFKLRKKIKLL